MSTPTSVHDSNAGHDFHVLWATRQIIEMLTPSATLQAVKMEGVAEEDLTGLPVNKDHFLAADLTEYHGGTHFAESNQTVIAQLKYSTRHPDEPWTGSRLRKRKGKNTSNSVIERLAASYQNLLDAGHSRDDIQQKVSIRLVSNQPLHTNLATLLSAVKAGLATFGNTQVTLAQLRGVILRKHHKELDNLYSCVGGGELQFTDFLHVLDLSGCGADDRTGQHLAVLTSLAPSVPTGERDTFLKLTNLVRNQALPENQHATPLTRHDVLAELKVFSEKDLFPEPPAFNYPLKPVPTAEAEAIATSLISSGSVRFLAHGAAGVGKSTTVQQIAAHLPTSSVVLIYDCYADGKYYNLSTGRHTLRNAIVQLSNELAVKTGLPFLVEPPADKYKLLEYFRLRLEATAHIVAATGGQLVIVIDAADNSITRSYKDTKEDCFVPYLWELELPANCRLLMTARTHRRSSLQAPADTLELELTGFDLAASTIRLQYVFPTASPSSAQRFHDRTGGNPRVQEYWLDAGGLPVGSFKAFLHSFRRPGTTAEEIIEDIVKAATVEVPDSERANEQLATLVCLQRPIPLTVFAQACGLTLPQANDFCHALKPGLLLDDDLIGFRDEDFETQLRVRPATATRLQATHERLGQHFLPLAADDVYAAQAVAEHLAATGRHEDLVALALSGPPVAFIPDSALRLRIERRRLQLALQAAAALRDDLAGAKLAILGAESLRANEAVKSLVLADIQLAARFGEAESVEEYFPAGTDDPWLGHVHYQLAALYARQPNCQHLAEQQLTQARAWVRRYIRLPEHERHRWHIGIDDIANDVEANYWLYGPDVAVEKLQRRWRPQACIRVLHPLIGQLITNVQPGELEIQVRQLNLPLLAQCIVQAALWDNRHAVSKEWCAEVATRLLPLLQRSKLKAHFSDWSIGNEVSGYALWPLHLAELFTHHHSPTETSSLLLDLLPPFPARRIGRYAGYASIITPLRASCLQANLQGIALTGLDLFPPPPKENEQQYHSGESYQDGEYRRELDGFIALYDCRAQLLTQEVSGDTVTSIIEQGLTKLYPDRKSTDYDRRNHQKQWLSSAISLAARASNTEQLLASLADRTRHFVGRYEARQLWLRISSETISSAAYRSLAFRCLERAANDAEQDTLPVAERRDILLACAQISHPYDEEFSRDFYRRALEAAHQVVGDDVAYRLQTAAVVAARLNAAEETAPSLANRLASLVEAYHPFVSDADHMPLQETMEAVMTLWPAAGAALTIRWDLLNLRELDDSVVAMAEAATASGFWQPDQALWLLKLCGDTADVSRVGLRLLDHMPPGSAAQRQQLSAPLSELANWVATDVPMRNRVEALAKVTTWAETHQLQHLPAIIVARQTIDFVGSLHPAVAATSLVEERDYALKKRTRREEREAAADRGDVDAFENWRATEPYSEDELLPLVTRLAQHISPTRRVALLNLLIRFRVSYWHRDEPLLQILGELLTQWRTYGPVQEWARTALPRLCAPNLLALTGERDIPNRLEQFSRLPFADTSRAALLLPAVSERMESLNAEMLSRIAASLMINGRSDAINEFVDWLLKRMLRQLEDDQKALPFKTLLPTATSPAVLPPVVYAQFIWTVCGHPDKRVRWQAIHAARQLLTKSNNDAFKRECLAELVRISRTTAGLQLETEEFYWQAARVWILLLLDRLSDEMPAALLPHLPIIAEHAFDPDFPHAQIRELARRILVRLQCFAPDAISSELAEKLRLCNRPKGCLLERGRFNREVEVEEAFPRIQRQNTFEFDEIDTVSYWFRPLGEVFGQSENKVTALAEHWIVAKWGRSTEECENNRLSDQRRYDWGLMRHYKVDEPTVDDLKMHLTHHALMCVAGELADNYPIYADDDEDARSTWEDWLDRHLPSAAPHSWIADRRGPSPLRADCWGELPKQWRRKPLAQYIEALGINEPNREGWIVLNGHHDMGKDGLRGNVDLSSVAVNPEAAQALLWALYPVKKNDYSFPTFGLSYSDEEVADDLPQLFILTPILEKEIEIYEKGIERHDTSARNTHTSYPRLSQFFSSVCGLTPTKAGIQYTDSKGEVVAECQVWEDDIRDKHRAYKEEAYSSGFRIWVRQDVLLSFLASTGLVLLMQVTLARNTENRKNTEYDLGKRRLALLHADGTFETVAGNCTLGAIDNQGA